MVQDLATQWIQAYPCKTKTSQETQRSLQKFLEPDRNPKVIYTDNSLEFGKACEDLWNHCTATPHRSETNVSAERAVRKVKEGTSAVLFSPKPTRTSRIRATQNLLREHKRVHTSFSSRRASRKCFMLTIPWNLAKLVKSYLGISVHRRLTVPKQMVLQKERHAESRKAPLLHCCNRV